MNLVEMRKVCKTYRMGERELPVLRDVDLTVSSNEYVAVVGASGSGKSTLMNILGCLDRPTRGEYLLSGQNVQSLGEAELAGVRSRQVGFVFQNFNLLARATALRNVMQPLAYRGMARRSRVQAACEALARVGLADRLHHLPSQLSDGQRQRVAIARALVARPSLVLADEPTGTLDAAATRQIMALFDEMHWSGQTVVVVTHEADIAARCGRTVELAGGRVVKDEVNAR